VRAALLYDFYGDLLTERQRTAFELHVHQDLSYAEMADLLGVSRAAAADLVRRALVALEAYEAAVGAVARHQEEGRRLEAIERALVEGRLEAARKSLRAWRSERGDVDV
jgi:predicted DNA-binding protein YlxM (UPF0122 family)